MDILPDSMWVHIPTPLYLGDEITRMDTPCQFVPYKLHF